MCHAGVLARRAKMLVLAPRARRRVSRCSIALQLCARRQRFWHRRRFVDASARRDSETMIYITCALATCEQRLLHSSCSWRAVSLGHHAGKRRVLASTCKLLAECYSCKRSDSHTIRRAESCAAAAHCCEAVSDFAELLCAELIEAGASRASIDHHDATADGGANGDGGATGGRDRRRRHHGNGRRHDAGALAPRRAHNVVRPRTRPRRASVAPAR